MREKKRTSPKPRLAAISFSSVDSQVKADIASTSDGWMPASSRASRMATQASSVSLCSRRLAKAVWPMPTIAALSLIAMTSPRSGKRRQLTHQPAVRRTLPRRLRAGLFGQGDGDVDEGAHDVAGWHLDRHVHPVAAAAVGVRRG